MNPPRRLFTVDRANRALLLVSRIVEDVVAKTAEAAELQRERRTAQREALDTIERKLSDLEGEFERLVGELETVGCELKDPRIGLIDFPAARQGKPICLCWRKGEPRVEWWHPIDTGYAGRRPISELERDPGPA